MQCPRCSELVSDESAECPVCHKSLKPSQSGAGLRLTLTGEYIEQATSSTNPISAISTLNPAGTGNTASAQPAPAVQAVPPPLRIVTVNADLNANLKESARSAVGNMPSRGPRALHVNEGMKWAIVVVAAVGSAASFYLWQHPVVAPITIHLPAMNVHMEGDLIETRGIPVPYLWLWGVYFLLAIMTQVFLPSPWRFADSRIRTNWVLNITGLFTLLLFCGAGMFQTGANLLQDEGVRASEAGSYTVNLNGTSQELPRAEAEQLVARTVAARERTTFVQWNLAALVSYLSLGGYAAWWLLTRPED